MGIEFLVEESSPQPAPGVAPPTEALPPLENGDRLTRSEFERRYEAMPELKKAELIEGVVYMPSPVRHKGHSVPHGQIIGWLAVYCAATPGVELGDNGTIRLDSDNEPQPDAFLRLESACGGQSRLSEDDYLEGAPELIVEVAASSASYDLHDKKRAYRRNGVREYVVWRVYDRKVDWFCLEQEKYVRLQPDEGGVIESRVFPGLRLEVKALLSGNLAGVLAEVEKGIASAEHQAFVERLSAALKKRERR